MSNLLCLCHMQDKADLLAIFSTISPISKDRVRAAMESAYRAAVNHMHFRTSCIIYSVAVMVLDLDSYKKDPDVVGDAVNIFISPNFSPSAGSAASAASEAALQNHC